MAKKDTTIGVFFGSKSPEHDVSILTAELIIKNLRKLGYSTVPVYIDKDGQFFVGPETTDQHNEILSTAGYFKEEKSKKLSKLPEASLAFGDSKNGQLVFKNVHLLE